MYTHTGLEPCDSSNQIFCCLLHLWQTSMLYMWWLNSYQNLQPLSWTTNQFWATTCRLTQLKSVIQIYDNWQEQQFSPQLNSHGSVPVWVTLLWLKLVIQIYDYWHKEQLAWLMTHDSCHKSNKIESTHRHGGGLEAEQAEVSCFVS